MIRPCLNALFIVIGLALAVHAVYPVLHLIQGPSTVEEYQP